MYSFEWGIELILWESVTLLLKVGIFSSLTKISLPICELVVFVTTEGPYIVPVGVILWILVFETGEACVLVWICEIKLGVVVW